MPLGTLGAPPPRRRGPIVALAVATAVIVPFVVRDMVSDDATDGAQVRTATTVAPAVADDEPAPSTTAAPVGDAPPPTVALDPRWAPKGSSRYSEDDDQTQRRIDRTLGAITTLPPPTTAPRPTVAPTSEPATLRTTQPPATRPPATQPPATQPPATQPPATQPPATQPPATAPPDTASVAPAVGDGATGG